MKFLFNHSSDGTSTMISLRTDTDGVGTILLRDGEWDALKAMLIHGRTWFQRGEVEVLFNDNTSTPAFVEGGK